MIFRRFTPTRDHAPVTATPDPLDQAWRIHAALVDWTGKVDFKASFALTLESALIAGVVVLSQKNHRLGSIGSLTIAVIYTIGLVLLSLGPFWQ